MSRVLFVLLGLELVNDGTLLSSLPLFGLVQGAGALTSLRGGFGRAVGRTMSVVSYVEIVFLSSLKDLHDARLVLHASTADPAGKVAVIEAC
jgi:hypothetical protein